MNFISPWSAAGLASLAASVVLGVPDRRPSIPERAAITPACLVAARDTASRFEFVSSPWVNLHNFLVKEGKSARAFDDDALATRGYLPEDTAAARQLSPAEYARWAAAVSFLANGELADRMGIDSLVIGVTNPLAAAAPNGNLEDVSLRPSLRRVLLDVMPIYRAVWWTGHETRNERWITSMRGQLRGRESCLVRRAEQVLRAPWPSDPIRVDASVYANWFGAYSTHQPTHITVSANARGTQETYGLEVLLHETGHAMMSVVDSALAVEATRQGKPLPAEFSHLLLFYTAGALVKEVEPAHTPFAEAFRIWDRNERARRYRALIEHEWQPYLNGSRPFCEAISSLIRELP